MRTYQISPRRGDILDTRGNLLATSVFVKTVCADPSLLGNRQAEVARALAPLLQMSEAELTQRLQPKLRQSENGQTATNRYVVLKRKVPVETWQKIKETMAQFPSDLSAQEMKNKAIQAFYRDLRASAITAEAADDQLRTYPNQTLAADVLGYVRTEERTDAAQGRWMETVGVTGIERSVDAQLHGVRGWRLTEHDSRSRELVALREQDVEPHDGLNAVLTIDAVVEQILETALADAMVKESPQTISGIVVRPRTGEILALAALPNFDPNNPGASVHAGASRDELRNPVIADCNEPGSTFKIVVVSGALNDQLVTLTDQFNCGEGKFNYAGYTLHDHQPFGLLTTQGIIAKSSNIGAAQIGIRMGNLRLYKYMRDFGFGARTGIPLPGETPGIMFPPENKEKWTKVTIAQIPMGQGVAVTSLQMVMAMSAIANHGLLMQPQLLNRLQDAEGNVVARYQPHQVRQVISRETARQMVEALKTVVTTNGTAPKAAMEHFTVAGKTGTAQKPPYNSDKYYASFIGFFPADDPEVCVYVSMDEPKSKLHQGGQVCAPVFKQIAEKVASYLNIRPDRDGESGIPELATLPNADQTARSATNRTP